MVIGNPYEFAFIIDKVPEWSADTFLNGIFFVAINGDFFPPSICTSTLNSDLYVFFEIAPASLITMPENSVLYAMNKDELFAILYGSLSSDSEIEGSTYKFSTTTMEDEGCYCFSVSNGETLRIIGANTKEITSSDNGVYKPIKVSEIKVGNSYVSDKLMELEKYYTVNLMI